MVSLVCSECNSLEIKELSPDAVASQLLDPNPFHKYAFRSAYLPELRFRALGWTCWRRFWLSLMRLLYWICYLFVLLVEKLTNGFDWIYIIIIAWWHQNCNRITLLLHYNNLSLGGVVSEKFIQYRVTAYLKHILLIFVTNKYVLLCFYFYW